MRNENEDRPGSGVMQAGEEETGPLDLNGEPVSRGDLAATARWLDGRRAEAQGDLTDLVERHSGALRVTNDHLVLIRADIAGLLGEMAQGFDANRRDTGHIQREIRNRRGRIRWLLAFVLGFLLGLAMPVDRLAAWLLSLGGAG